MKNDLTKLMTCCNWKMTGKSTKVSCEPEKIKIFLRFKEIKTYNNVGFKSLSQSENMQNKAHVNTLPSNNGKFKVGGLIFPSKEEYDYFRGLDCFIENLIKKSYDKEITFEKIQEFFDNIPTIDVIET